MKSKMSFLKTIKNYVINLWYKLFKRKEEVKEEVKDENGKIVRIKELFTFNPSDNNPNNDFLTEELVKGRKNMRKTKSPLFYNPEETIEHNKVTKKNNKVKLNDLITEENENAKKVLEKLNKPKRFKNKAELVLKTSVTPEEIK